jgi:Flp pilus assembly protein TadD
MHSIGLSLNARTTRKRCANGASFFFDHATFDEAEQTLRALIHHIPYDGSAHHNLGTLLMRTGRHEEAVEEYPRALRYRCKTCAPKNFYK